MTSLTIHGIDDNLQQRLRLQAAQHGYSIEEEAKDILRSVLVRTEVQSGALMLKRIQERFAPLKGVDFDLPPRGSEREPPGFA